MSAEKSFAEIDDMLVALDKLTTIANRNEHKWHWSKLRVYADALFKRGPFQVGDRVRLKVTPEINAKKSWGWIGAKHFLVAGAMATVEHVDFYDDHFCADVIFDDESWMGLDGTIHPREPKDKHLYRLWETQIERVPADPCTTSPRDIDHE